MSIKILSAAVLFVTFHLTQSVFCADEGPNNSPGGSDIGNNGDGLRIEFAETSKEFFAEFEKGLTQRTPEDRASILKKVEGVKGRSQLWAESDDVNNTFCIHGISEGGEILLSPRNCGAFQWRIDIVVEWHRFLKLEGTEDCLQRLLREKPDHWLVSLKIESEIELENVKYQAFYGKGTLRMSTSAQTQTLVVTESTLSLELNQEKMLPRFAEILSWKSEKNYLNRFEGLAQTPRRNEEWQVRIYPLAGDYALLRMTVVPRSGIRVLRPSVLEILKKVEE